jgi:hypothetical protein
VYFHNQHGDEIDAPNILAHGEMFLIADMPELPGQDMISLFIEDDGHWHLMHSFSAFWLSDLATVVRIAVAARDAKYNTGSV